MCKVHMSSLHLHLKIRCPELLVDIPLGVCIEAFLEGRILSEDLLHLHVFLLGVAQKHAVAVCDKLIPVFLILP